MKRMATATLAAAALAVVLSGSTSARVGRATVVPAISIDAARQNGFVHPTTTGQMMEWALPEMNGAWAEKLTDRSIEGESVSTRRSPGGCQYSCAASLPEGWEDRRHGSLLPLSRCAGCARCARS